MRIRTLTAIAATAMLPQLAMAQASNPVAEAFRNSAAREGKNLIAAAEEFPANKYSYKPTPAQMSFGDIVVHLSEGNDFLCGTIAGTKAPARSKIAATAPKAQLVSRLEETFEFCNKSLASLDDSKLSEEMEVFGRKMTRAAVMTLTTADFADHYSQAAIYLRLNGLLPPTAKKPAP